MGWVEKYRSLLNVMEAGGGGGDTWWCGDIEVTGIMGVVMVVGFGGYCWLGF